MDADRFQPLLAAARSGDAAAKNELFGWARQEVRQRAPGQVAAADASDAAQEVCLRLHRGFEQFQGQTMEAFLAWAQRTLCHHAIDQQRHDHAQQRDVNREVAGGDLFCGIAEQGTSPTQALLRNEQRARLEAALLRLPERQRLVFRLRMQDELPFATVAECVGVTENHARVLLLRATENLRNQLGESS